MSQTCKSKSEPATTALGLAPSSVALPVLQGDDGVLHAVERSLDRSPYRELRQATCYVHDGTIVLRGNVSSFYLKQIAQTLVSGVAHAQDIHNEIEVVYPAGQRTGSIANPSQP